MGEVKPCPFCGDKYPKYITKNDFGCRGADYEILYALQCEICGCQTKFFTRLLFAIDAWNRRAKDNGKYLELPCKIGDTVYEIYSVEHETCSGSCRYCDTDCSRYYTCWHTTYEWKIATCEVDLPYLFHNWNLFGETVFLTYEEAAKARKEKEQKNQ